MNRRDFLRTTLAGATVLPSTSPFLSGPVLAADGRRKRLRELGIVIGHLAPGPLNAITDVRGVRVGQTTIVKGQGRGAARTGVTVLLPHEGNIYEERLFASSFGLNGWGELTGLAAIEETGLLATPIFLTGTYNVGIVQSAASSSGKRSTPAAFWPPLISATRMRWTGSRQLNGRARMRAPSSWSPPWTFPFSLISSRGSPGAWSPG